MYRPRCGKCCVMSIAMDSFIHKYGMDSLRQGSLPHQPSNAPSTWTNSRQTSFLHHLLSIGKRNSRSSLLRNTRSVRSITIRMKNESIPLAMFYWLHAIDQQPVTIEMTWKAQMQDLKAWLCPMHFLQAPDPSYLCQDRYLWKCSPTTKPHLANRL